MALLSLRANPNAFPPHHWGRDVAGLDEDQVELNLAVGVLWQARGDQRWRVIICRRGAIWITQERDGVDYVLEAGEIFIVTLRGLVLVQAIEPALVTITPSIKATPHVGAYRIFR
jgi:hypothetical protein